MKLCANTVTYQIPNNAIAIRLHIGSNSVGNTVQMVSGLCLLYSLEKALLRHARGILKTVDGTLDMKDVFASITDILG